MPTGDFHFEIIDLIHNQDHVPASVSKPSGHQRTQAADECDTNRKSPRIRESAPFSIHAKTPLLVRRRNRPVTGNSSNEDGVRCHESSTQELMSKVGDPDSLPSPTEGLGGLKSHRTLPPLSTSAILLSNEVPGVSQVDSSEFDPSKIFIFQSSIPNSMAITRLWTRLLIIGIGFIRWWSLLSILKSWYLATMVSLPLSFVEILFAGTIFDWLIRSRYWLPTIVREVLELHPIAGISVSSFCGRWTGDELMEYERYLIPWNNLHNCTIVEMCDFWSFRYMLTLILSPNDLRTPISVGQTYMARNSHDQLVSVFTEARLKLRDLMQIRKMINASIASAMDTSVGLGRL